VTATNWDYVQRHPEKQMRTEMYQSLKNRAALLSITSNSILIVFKLTVGIMMHSVSVISEAIHSGIDLVAAIIAWYSVRESGKPADAQHQFGHGKIENVAGTIEALLIFGAAIVIIWQAGHKLVSGTVVVENIGIGAVVMGLSAIANYLVSRHLFNVAIKSDSVALKADALHLRTDVYTSAGVLGGLAAIKLTGISMIDPLVAIVVALMIIKAAYDLTKNAFFPILDVKLPDDEEALIYNVMSHYNGRYIEYHKLRTRKSGHIRQIDMHLVVPKQMTVEQGHALGHEIAAEIKQCLPNSQVLVHVEPCPGGCPVCAVECPKSEDQTVLRENH
jgi:cation diffusion facilitator family transporter